MHFAGYGTEEWVLGDEASDCETRGAGSGLGGSYKVVRNYWNIFEDDMGALEMAGDGSEEVEAKAALVDRALVDRREEEGVLQGALILVVVQMGRNVSRRTWRRFERAGHARPRTPSMGPPLKLLERVFTGEKYCDLALTPATLTVSV